ncbi:hypothetical protein HJD18_00570 [Thermoleophilia bacterium SCSIO 60948]|nr:hypothetical protein HJD18_00570 [Thermoleophilia bacterium SCSIO 60948]
MSSGFPRRAFSALGALALSAALSVSAFAASGDLDSGFSTDGRARVDFGAPDRPGGIATDRRGRVVVVGTSAEGARAGFDNFAVARLRPGGGLDRSFSGDGRRTLDLGHEDSAYAVAIQPDGKILVAGETGFYEDGGSPTYSYRFAVARLERDGRIDRSFGRRGTREIEIDPGGGDAAFDVALDGRGRILLAGESGSGSDALQPSLFALTRLDAAGDLDRSFSGDGIAEVQFGDYAVAKDVELDSLGRIVLAGYGASDVPRAGADIALARFLPDGTLDPSFGDDGRVTAAPGPLAYAESAAALSVGADDELTIAGQFAPSFDGPADDTDMIVARFAEDGAPDASFSGDGFRRLDLLGGYDSARGLLPRGSGLIVGGDVASGARGARTRLGFRALRASGRIDRSFAGDGTMTVRAAASSADLRMSDLTRRGDRILSLNGVDASGSDADLSVVQLRDRR